MDKKQEREVVLTAMKGTGENDAEEEGVYYGSHKTRKKGLLLGSEKGWLIRIDAFKRHFLKSK